MKARSILTLVAVASFWIPHHASGLVTATSHRKHLSNEGLTRTLQRFLPGAPAFPYWHHVGVVNRSTGIYLGDGRVLTAAHVKAGDFRMQDGSLYRAVRDSEVYFTNRDGSYADICIFEIRCPPGSLASRLPSIPVGPVSPPKGALVLLLGAGSGNASEAQEVGGPNFLWNWDYRVRWGLNRVEERFSKPMRTYEYATVGFATRFNPGPLECQATPGDSGGAAFLFNQKRGRWELGGLILAVDGEHGMADFGDQTYIADLSKVPLKRRPAIRFARF